jgi:hypothetical protein
MLAALVAIALFADGVGLIIHYGFAGGSIVPAVPIVHNLTGNASASSQITQ